ncbi:MAG: AraC family transcriptional regulator [Motiliproteus sp.]
MPSPPPIWHSFEIQQLLRELTDNQGASLEQLLAGTTVTAQNLQNPAFRLTLDQELSLYTRIAHHNNNPTLGISHGQSLGLSRYGMLGQAMLGASTVIEALKLAVQFMPLISWSCKMTLSRETYQDQACYSLSIAPTPADQYAVEMETESTLASLHCVLNEIVMDRVFFQAVYFAHPNRADSDEVYQQVFQCPVIFAAGCNKVILSDQLMSRSLPYAKPEQAPLMRELCSNMVAPLRHDYNTVVTLREYLQQHLPRQPALEDAARHFNISSRTLRRRLTRLNTSYQSILDEVRFNTARRQLTQSQTSLDAISMALGYKDVRGFRIAFKRWTGVSPSAYRQQHQRP